MIANIDYGFMLESINEEDEYPKRKRKKKKKKKLKGKTRQVKTRQANRLKQDRLKHGPRKQYRDMLLQIIFIQERGVHVFT